MGRILIVLSLLLCGFVNKKQIRIAVIDTGFLQDGSTKNVKLCKFGHKDFTETNSLNREVPIDIHGHGTNIVGILDDLIDKNIDYCIIVIKYYNVKVANENDLTLNRAIDAVEYATFLNADYLNFSSGGEEYSEKESKAVKEYLNNGGTFVAAAGNENKNINEHPYYPAINDPRIIVVGNLKNNKKKAPTSNYGSKVTRWEIGENITYFGITMGGTSQSAAVATAKIINERNSLTLIKKQDNLNSNRRQNNVITNSFRRN